MRNFETLQERRNRADHNMVVRRRNEIRAAELKREGKTNFEIAKIMAVPESRVRDFIEHPRFMNVTETK